MGLAWVAWLISVAQLTNRFFLAVNLPTSKCIAIGLPLPIRCRSRRGIMRYDDCVGIKICCVLSRHYLLENIGMDTGLSAIFRSL